VTPTSEYSVVVDIVAVDSGGIDRSIVLQSWTFDAKPQQPLTLSDTTLFEIDVVPNDEHENGGNELLKTMTIGSTYRYTVVGDINDYTNNAIGKLSYRLNIESANAGAKEDIVINTETGTLQASPSSKYTAFVQILAVDDGGVDRTVVLQNWTFTARPADITDMANGPNGKGCKNGVMVDDILYNQQFVCSCYSGFSGDNCQLSDALPQLQVVVNDTLQGQSENSTVNGTNYAGRSRTLWAIQQDYNLARVNLVSANMSNGITVNSSAIQFVLDNIPPGFYINGNTGELLGKPTQPRTMTTSTLYATYEGTTKAKLWDLNFEFKAADTANNANGPNGKGCSGNGTKIDEVEFDSDFTCDCNVGFNVTASANCDVLNSPPSDAAPSDAANSGANQWELMGPLIAVIAVTLVLLTVWRVQVSKLKHPRVSEKFATLNTVYDSQPDSVAETQLAVDEPFAQPEQSENVNGYLDVDASYI